MRYFLQITSCIDWHGPPTTVCNLFSQAGWTHLTAVEGKKKKDSVLQCASSHIMKDVIVEAAGVVRWENAAKRKRTPLQGQHECRWNKCVLQLQSTWIFCKRIPTDGKRGGRIPAAPVHRETAVHDYKSWGKRSANSIGWGKGKGRLWSLSKSYLQSWSKSNAFFACMWKIHLIN